MSKSLDELCRHLEQLDGRIDLPDLLEELEQMGIDSRDVADHIHFSGQSYTRNLVRAGPWYSVLVLCWKNGQRSPIHDHLGSTCGVRVLRGTMTETLFEFAPNGHIKAVASCDFEPGSVVGGQDYHLHQVSNLQAGGADLVTLHVYSPPLVKMGTYSLTDTTRGEELMLMEFCDASGI
jgi:cysteine dioxygenase